MQKIIGKYNILVSFLEIARYALYKKIPAQSDTAIHLHTEKEEKNQS